VSYRNGSHNERNLYRAGVSRDTDEHIGVMFTPEVARYTVLALNAYRVTTLDNDAPRYRLSRIAEAHTTIVLSNGTTNGLCGECDHPWPCPTYTWATEQRGGLHPWNTIDDADYDCSDTRSDVTGEDSRQ
jgi:hypothetical protein